MIESLADMTAMMADCMAVHDRDDRNRRDHGEAWFRGVYTETYRPLLAYARRRVDPATADEVVADAFLTAWRRRADVPHGSERLWLFGVARNLIRNATRSQRRSHAAQARLHMAPPHVPPPEAADPAVSVVDERSTLVRTALEALSEADREVLMLVAWEELSHAEIGQVLGISANASAIRVHRARKRLAARIDHLVGMDGTGRGDLSAKEMRPRGQEAGEADKNHAACQPEVHPEAPDPAAEGDEAREGP